MEKRDGGPLCCLTGLLHNNSIAMTDTFTVRLNEHARLNFIFPG
jgi:hypothetical protein